METFSALLAICVGNLPVTGEFPTQKASNAENVSIWWRHYVKIKEEVGGWTIRQVGAAIWAMCWGLGGKTWTEIHMRAELSFHGIYSEWISYCYIIPNTLW